MNKKAAAEYLQVSTRAIERYTAKGKLTPHYIAGKSGQVADYDQAQLEQLKQEMAAPMRIIRRKSDTRDNRLSHLSDLPNISQSLTPAGLGEFLKLMLAGESGKKRKAVAPVESKLLLSLDDAAALGFSRGELLDAIHAKKLKAHKRGKWRIKRADLDAYVKKL